MKIGRIFEYIQIFVQFSIRIFIRTFVRVKFFDTNIFGYSFVSKFLRMSHSGPDYIYNIEAKLGDAIAIDLQSETINH